MEFCLPEAITAALISKGGQAIEKLRGLSLASITIQYSEGEGDGNSNIILRGERQSISETFSLILMRLLCLRPSLLLPVDSDARLAVSSRLDRTVLSRSESFSEFLFSALNPNIILGPERVCQRELGRTHARLLTLFYRLEQTSRINHWLWRLGDQRYSSLFQYIDCYIESC